MEKDVSQCCQAEVEAWGGLQHRLLEIVFIYSTHCLERKAEFFGTLLRHWCTLKPKVASKRVKGMKSYFSVLVFGWGCRSHCVSASFAPGGVSASTVMDTVMLTVPMGWQFYLITTRCGNCFMLVTQKQSVIFMHGYSRIGKCIIVQQWYTSTNWPFCLNRVPLQVYSNSLSELVKNVSPYNLLPSLIVKTVS